MERTDSLVNPPELPRQEIWIPKQEYDILQKMMEGRRKKFIEHVRNMDWAARAFCLFCAESEKFAADNDLQNVQYMKDVAQAWEIIKSEKS